MDQKSNHQLFWSSFSCFKYSRNVGLVASIVLCVVYRKVSLRIRITKCSVTHSEVGFIMPQQYAKICFWMQRQSGSILDRPEPLFFCSPRKRKTRAALSLSLSLSWLDFYTVTLDMYNLSFNQQPNRVNKSWADDVKLREFWLQAKWTSCVCMQTFFLNLHSLPTF